MSVCSRSERQRLARSKHWQRVGHSARSPRFARHQSFFMLALPESTETAGELGETCAAGSGARQAKRFDRRLADMLAERPVRLELPFVEELVGGRFVREGRTAVAVFADDLVLVAGAARFQVEQVSGLQFARVVDLPDRQMLRAMTGGIEAKLVE